MGNTASAPPNPGKQLPLSQQASYERLPLRGTTVSFDIARFLPGVALYRCVPFAGKRHVHRQERIYTNRMAVEACERKALEGRSRRDVPSDQLLVIRSAHVREQLRVLNLTPSTEAALRRLRSAAGQGLMVDVLRTLGLQGTFDEGKDKLTLYNTDRIGAGDTFQAPSVDAVAGRLRKISARHPKSKTTTA